MDKKATEMCKEKLRNINSDIVFLHFVEMSTQINEMCKKRIDYKKAFFAQCAKKRSPKYAATLV